ncbi:MAG: FAD:protein FMN transferase [Candidatus Cloacimonetes bacterium]|nr:FAD:protein FMN transferase [Candidatus Cloacimonadota bacterium]MCF7813316.1 FAD:protein FMN transferase [Candidatus Cloacimonadota bacterium]MCF7867391.1 FAD:protein FMN transferase [Candidatus Cloacimonadota bacterium]MCF7882825.1 FAD:protein FMN transferase [Candidatus Cloacimonadota bacterium]
MKKKDIINIIILIAVIAFGLYRYFYRVRNFTETRFLLDTIITINIETRDINGADYLEGAFKLIENLEDKLSFYKEGSTIWNFNEGLKPELKLNPDLKKIIDLSSKIYKETSGKYDVSIGRLSELWNYDKKWIPSEDSIKTALNFVGFDKLQIAENKLIKPNGFKLNLGSLAKGFIIDKTFQFLNSKGITNGFINAGGDIRIFGQNKPLNIGIQHPRDDRNKVIGVLKIKDKSIVTSGDYERFFMKDGIRYHHILDPDTGYPSRNATSVTIIANKAMTADAYSTALFLMQPENAMQLVNSLPGIEASILVENAGKIEIYESNGLDEYKSRE